MNDSMFHLLGLRAKLCLSFVVLVTLLAYTYPINIRLILKHVLLKSIRLSQGPVKERCHMMLA